MIDFIQICYIVFAPLSVISEFVLLYSFLRLKQHKDHPEVLIFWQFLSQIILDIHWFTGIVQFKQKLSTDECLLLGSSSVYFYYLSWDYTLFLSAEILLKILNPYKTGYKKRRIWYHTFAHLSSATIFIILMISETNGNSVLDTCFVEEFSVYELLILIPALLHFPLCVGIIGYALYISHNTHYAIYLKYHIMVVMTFSFCWVPIGIVHGLFYYRFHTILPEWYVYVIANKVSVFFGAISGFLIFMVRMMQKGLLKRVIYALFSPSKLKDNLAVKIQAPDINQGYGSFSEMFSDMTVTVLLIQGVKDIIQSIRNVFLSCSQPGTIGQNLREWSFFIGIERKKVKVFQYNVQFFERIMNRFNVSYEDLVSSFRLESDEELQNRLKTSGGRSGAFFYFTADQEFLLKTITTEEFNILNTILPDYTDRVCSPEGSFLAKICAMFKIKINKAKSFKLVLMENLASRLGNPIIFDMKGSSVDRKTLLDSFKDIDEIPRGLVYKDTDFLENIKSFTVYGDELQQIKAKIGKDTKMLEKNYIMDYSLLVLIEKVKSLKETIIEKAFVATHDNFVVFIGIIDFLQIYNLKKKLESKYKSFRSSNNIGASAISPAPYRERFMMMLERIFQKESLN